MNLKEYSTQITEHKLTDLEWEFCLKLYINGDTLRPKTTITKHLNKLNLIQTCFIEIEVESYFLNKLNNNIRKKLDSILLSHTDKTEWETCLSALYPNKKINNSLYLNISFLSQKNRYQENFLAYWSDTLKIGNIIHPHSSGYNNYNEYMTSLISQAHLENKTNNTNNKKQTTHKI